jgi:hypothetical protein
MRQTFAYLEDLPAFETSVVLPVERWLDMSRMATALAYQDVLQLVRDCQRTLRPKLLPNVQFHERNVATPSPILGSLLIYPDDDYWRKTEQKTWEENRSHPSPGVPTMSLGLEFSLHRTHRFSQES